MVPTALNLVVLAVAGRGVGEAAPISSVSISRPFFSPALGQKVEIGFTVQTAGGITVSLLDRDGVEIRRLISERAAKHGRMRLVWDGRDDGGEIVADEAYSLRINLQSKRGKSSYLPAGAEPQTVSVEAASYDRRGGILSYKLPWPARVHAQAGVAHVNPATGEPSGPVLKTIVNREPRAGGRVVESWNGLDESGTVYVPDLPDFKIAVFATRLPENAIICIGNRLRSFLDGFSTRSGKSVLPPAGDERHHHLGLSAIEDISPELSLTPLDATWVSQDKLWLIQSGPLKVKVSLKGPTAATFCRQPGKVVVFLGNRSVLEQPPAQSSVPLEVPPEKLPNEGVLTVNWTSEYGPTAVNSFRFKRLEPVQPAR